MECIGGPADGLEVREQRGAFAWVDPADRCSYDRDAPGRVLYAQVEGESHAIYLPGGDTCRSCGVVLLARLSSCPLCGATL